jgi:hypothetical protein
MRLSCGEWAWRGAIHAMAHSPCAYVLAACCLAISWWSACEGRWSPPAGALTQLLHIRKLHYKRARRAKCCTCAATWAVPPAWQHHLLSTQIIIMVPAKLSACRCRRCLCEWLRSDAISKGLTAAATGGARAAVQAAVAAERHEV